MTHASVPSGEKFFRFVLVTSNQLPRQVLLEVYSAEAEFSCTWDRRQMSAYGGCLFTMDSLTSPWQQGMVAVQFWLTPMSHSDSFVYQTQPVCHRKLQQDPGVTRTKERMWASVT